MELDDDLPERPTKGLKVDRSGATVNPPLTSAGRIWVEGGQPAPAEGYWFQPGANRVRYLEPGQAAPPGRWTFVTATYNLSRGEVRATIVQLGLFVGEMADIKFE